MLPSTQGYCGALLFVCLFSHSLVLSFSRLLLLSLLFSWSLFLIWSTLAASFAARLCLPLCVLRGVNALVDTLCLRAIGKGSLDQLIYINTPVKFCWIRLLGRSQTVWTSAQGFHVLCKTGVWRRSILFGRQYVFATTFASVIARLGDYIHNLGCPIVFCAYCKPCTSRENRSKSCLRARNQKKNKKKGKSLATLLKAEAGLLLYRTIRVLWRSPEKRAKRKEREKEGRTQPNICKNNRRGTIICLSHSNPLFVFSSHHQFFWLANHTAQYENLIIWLTLCFHFLQKPHIYNHNPITIALRRKPTLCILCCAHNYLPGPIFCSVF